MSRTKSRVLPFFERSIVVSPKTWLRITKLIVGWLVDLMRFYYHIPISMFDEIFDHLDTRLRTRGLRDTVIYIKGLRTNLTQTLAGEKRKVDGIPLYRGYPKILGKRQIIEQLKEDMRRLVVVRLLLTILYSTRALSLGGLPNYEPIISKEKSSYTVDLNKVDSFWRAQGYWSYKDPTIPRSVSFSSYHLTTKSGPNGHALWTAIDDLTVLDAPTLQAIGIVGGRKLARNIELLKENLSLFDLKSKKDRQTLRRITSIPDKEDKVRVIAIGDFWSQQALAPLHRFLFRILRRIPQDCTFDQGKLLETIANSGKKMFSFDLTAATDRFPIRVIAKVLEGRFPKVFVTAWRHQMVGLPFLTEDKSEIWYGAGNPMGLYTSWASFALAHHFLVYDCCLEAGVPWGKTQYAMLGDDIVIVDEKVAVIYLRKMSELGVEISQAKSHQSEMTMEFAKRIFLRGVEISPFPVSSVQGSSIRSFLLVELISEQMKRGWILDPVGYSIGAFYAAVFACTRSKVRVFADSGHVVYQQRSAIKGQISGTAFLADYCVRRQLPTPFEFTQDDFERFLSWAALEAFVDAQEAQGKPGQESLGDLATSLVISITGDPYTSSADELVSAHPVTYSHGQVSEMYMDQSKRCRAVSMDGADWPKLQRCISLPISDRIYSERSSRTIQRSTHLVSTKLSKLILDFNYLKGLEQTQ